MRTPIRSLALAGCLVAGCTGPADVGDTPRPSPQAAELDATMFDDVAMARFSPADRAYVMGHATALYLYGKTLPKYVASSGFLYRPGMSAPEARVSYDWVVVTRVISGGADGTGVGIEDYGHPTLRAPSIPQPIATTQPPTGGAPGGETYGDPTPTPATQPPGSTPSGGPGGETYGDPTPTPTGTVPPASSTPPGSSTPGGEIPPGTPSKPPIDGSCEDFLNPAAKDARVLVAQVNVDRVLGDLAATADATTLRARFNAGMQEALYLENEKQDTRSSEPEAMKAVSRREGMCKHSPLVLDLDGDGVAASTIAAGVSFDLLSTGRPVRTAWPLGGDALLALDRDGDGKIADGSELFGNARRAGYADGFAALAALDEPRMGGNGDGRLDRHDAAFAYLVAWRDANRDGVSQPTELAPLVDLGIVSFDLHPTNTVREDAAGNTLRGSATFERVTASGAIHQGTMVDVWFRYRDETKVASR